MAAPILAVAAKWAGKKLLKKGIQKGVEKADGNGNLFAVLGGSVVFIGVLVLAVFTSLVGIMMGVLGALGGFSAASGAGAAYLSCINPPSEPSSSAIADIPAVAFKAYQQAGEATGLDWVYLAAIGKVETDHGRYGGRHLTDAGDEAPTPIVNSIGASGPMQFLMTTWNGGAAKDGNFDGTKNVQNIFDAALGAGFYLKQGGAPGNMRKAIFSYNRANWYVDKVMEQAAAYRNAAEDAVEIEGGVTEPIKGHVAVAHANIPNRSSADGYRSTLQAMTAKDPDFITLNEQSSRTLSFIESAAPGYTAWRDNTVPGSDAGQANQATGNVVLWKRNVYTPIDKGRVQLVDNDRTMYQGRPVTWDRFAMWALLERKSDGAIMSIVSVHHMTNPGKYGPDKPKRQAMYGQGMDTLLGLTEGLSEHGPVFVGGDFNTHDEQREPWTAYTKMTERGFGMHNNAVDYIWFQRSLGINMVGSDSGPTPEPDHRWLFARFAMNGATTGHGGPGSAARWNKTAQLTSNAPLSPLSALAKQATAKGWQLPMTPGSYTLTAHWGEEGPWWESGYHSGLDFGAPFGTQVYAAAKGIVRLNSGEAWAGPNFVMIDHGMIDGKRVWTWYAHMSSKSVSDGDVVKAGDPIGKVGSEGNSSGDHLHFEVEVDGRDVDPQIWLASAGAPSPGGTASDNCGPTGSSGIVGGNGAWGGYENGMIPLDAMCPLSFYPSAYFECTAGAALEELNDNYEKKFGRHIGPVGGYRSYAAQVQCREEKGSLCAVPGTSNHGWGLAADLDGGGISKFGTPQHAWMRKNASSYGWVLPDWARENGSKPEPWHWEFMGTGNNGQNGGTTALGKVGGPQVAHGTDRYTMASYNVLGASHTDGPGANKPSFDHSTVRMPRTVAVLRNQGVDVAGFQEFQPSQQRLFRNQMPGWGLYANKDNAVVWNTARFSFVAATTFRIPYFHGSSRLMPLVRLKSKTTGVEFVVGSVHNPADARGPAQKYRDEAMRIEADITRTLSAAGIPVFLTGDMNDREEFFCPFTSYGVMHAANGGSNGGGGCNPPGNITIDWIFGNRQADFANYRTVRPSPAASDHAATIAGVTTKS